MWILWVSKCSLYLHFNSLQGKLCEIGQMYIGSLLSSSPNQSISFYRNGIQKLVVSISKPIPADTDQNNFKASMLRTQVFYETRTHTILGANSWYGQWTHTEWNRQGTTRHLYKRGKQAKSDHWEPTHQNIFFSRQNVSLAVSFLLKWWYFCCYSA